MVYGTVAAYNIINPLTGKHFGGSLGEIPGLGQMGYVAMTAFALNLVVSIVLSAVLNATKVSNGEDETTKSDYFADAGDPRVEKDKAVREMTAAEGEPV
jgi:SSS family solute:Na+ symporter